MASGVYSCPALAVTPRGHSPLVMLAHMLAHPSGRLRRCSLRTYGSTVHLPRLRARLSALRVRLRRMFPSKQSFFGASLASRIHAFNALARPSAIPSAYRPRPSKASLFRRLPNAFLTAIKSASFPMALLHDFLDRHPLRRKRAYYTIFSSKASDHLQNLSSSHSVFRPTCRH